MSRVRMGSRCLAATALVVTFVWTWLAWAQPPEKEPRLDAPELRPPSELGALAGKPIRRFEIVTLGGRWQEPVELKRVRVGDTLSVRAARAAMQELTDTGRYAEARAEALAEGDGVVLRIIVLPRRIVGGVKMAGGALNHADTMEAAGLKEGEEITARSLPERRARIVSHYREHGFPEAVVEIDLIDTDDPMEVVVAIDVKPGAPRVVTERKFQITPGPLPELLELLKRYAIDTGDRADAVALGRSDESMQDKLRQRGWHRATVTHQVQARGNEVWLTVRVDAGPLIRLRFEGNRHFDSDRLEASLELEDTPERSAAAVREGVERYYVDRGFLDVRVTVVERGRQSEPIHDLVVTVREGRLVRVVAREFPCLSGARSADDVGDEIDGVLGDVLPGAGVVGAVDSGAVDDAIGPKHTTGARVDPFEPNLWQTYSLRAYESARNHLQELYRSEGYLSATVGPVVVMRRRCDPRSPPGGCVPIGQRLRPPTACPATPTSIPAEDGAPPPGVRCVPDPSAGIRCEPEIVLHIPVKLGPRAVLWDVAFDGNEILTERALSEVAELDPGGPVSQVALEKARLRVHDEYAEEGFAFASVEVELDVSPDRTRARARFVISERDRVRIKGIVVRGALITNESLILRRVAFEEGDIFRRSDVRATEERLATLGVFSSVTVGFEDPEVPAREKVVVITVSERPPQYMDVRPGFSTGEGVRVTFEYGHRNMGGEAIQLIFRVQLGFLPDPFIFNDDVRRKFNELDLKDRLERRITASVEFPEFGLGPLFRLGVDGVDVRDNARDYGLTKDAVIVTVRYRPTTRFTWQVGGSFELNDATIFGEAEKGALDAYIQANPGASRLLLVPEGRTFAIAQRTGVVWDRRDNPFNATQGTFLSAGVEHVGANPVADEATITSNFMRLTNRLAGYVRLSERGLALATSFRWGYNAQLVSDSETYPDRLFFFGGVDSIRGFLQDSVIPQDIAERILADENLADADPNKLTEREIVVRGGDFVMNPRAELRIPLGGVFQTAVFLDTGNLWVAPENIEPWKLRYATGSGLRATTPVGPLALDVGYNIDRRSWEDPFAFHFSIGLF